MDDLVLQRSIIEEEESDLVDALYGDRDLQLNLHNGAVEVTFPSADILHSLITTLNTGMEGGGNYIVLLYDRVLLISDATQLGVQQYVEQRPDLDTYSFISSLPMELRRTSRIILKTKFSNVKNALAKDKASKTKKRTVTLKKAKGNPNLEVIVSNDGVPGSPHTLSCSIVSQLPERPTGEAGSSPIWSGEAAKLIAGLSQIYINKSDHIYIYLKTNGTGIYFYAYHVTAGHGARGRVGDVTDEEFRTDEKNIKLIPKVSRDYIEYRVTRKALKSIQKITNEKASTMDIYCISSSMLKLECIIEDDLTHSFYFSS